MAMVSGACVIGFKDEWAELYQPVRHREALVLDKFVLDVQQETHQEMR